MASTVDPKDIPNADSVDIRSQENVSPRGQNGRPPIKQQVRHRASVACASCRDRRIRCVVPKNQSACTACQRSGAECIIKNDDERRRPISKAYMSSLSDRISMLEGMLLEKGVVPPPPAHPPKTRHDAQSKTQDDEEPTTDHVKQTRIKDTTSPACDVPSPPDSRNDEFAIPRGEHGDASMSGSQVLQPLAKEDSPFRMLDPKQEDIIQRLLSTKGNLSFDQIGRLRFFGPTANSHVYAESSDQIDSREPPEQVRRAERIIRSFSIETHDYLMNQFFAFYNSVLKVIDRDAFEFDRESQGNSPKFYSSFLHVAILAMGYRVADMDRDDMRKITLAPRESTLHREAKYMLDIELERPGGIPSVQALLLLGDLECGVGRDNTGWMYSGMANRLAFDIGLHLDCRNNDMPEQENQIRNMVMRACIIYDRYWGLFLGRPLAIKSQDVDLLSNRFSQLTSIGFEPAKRDLITEIYEQLIELMELAGRIVETRDNSGSNHSSDPYNLFAAGEAEDNAYLHVINLDRQLQNWYRRLPEHLSWKPGNIKTAPYSFFLLHQQYHVTMILLHRPWAKYGSIVGDGASTGSHSSPASDRAGVAPEATTTPMPMMGTGGQSLGIGEPHTIVHDSRTSLSRSICTQQAIRVARIFWQHRQRYDGRKIFVTGIQHAGTAAIALIAALAYQRSEADRRTYVGYLEILSDALRDMSFTYHPASRMDDLLKAVLEQIRNSIGELPRPRSGSTSYHELPFSVGGRSGVSLNSDASGSILPLRREAADLEFPQPLKKRRPTSSRRASEFALPRPPFFNPQSQPTPPGSYKGQSQPGSSLSQSQSPLDSFLFSMGVGDTSNQLNMDFLCGTDIKQPEDAQKSVMDRMNNMGNMDLAIPSSETWGMDNLQDHHVTGPGSLDPPAADWTSGPAGLSASSVLGQSAAISTGIMSGAPKFGGASKDETGSGHLKATSSSENNTDQKTTHSTGLGQNGGMDWMEGDSNIVAMSPVSLSGLIDSADKTPNGDEAASRNRALDFFSFS